MCRLKQRTCYVVLKKNIGSFDNFLIAENYNLNIAPEFLEAKNVLF